MTAGVVLVPPLVSPALVWALALVASAAWTAFGASRAHLDRRHAYWAYIAGLFGALCGGHVFVALTSGMSTEPLEWLRVWQGPQSALGALFGGGLAAAAYLFLGRRPVLRYADAMAPAAALGYGVARVGCLLNGDDFGTRSAVPWAVRFAPGTLAFEDHVARGWIAADARASLPVHPVQIYSSLAAFALFAILSRRGAGRPGAAVATLAIGYGASRFTLEWLRGDARPWLGPFSPAHVGSAVLAIAGALMWQRGRSTAGAVEGRP